MKKLLIVLSFLFFYTPVTAFAVALDSSGFIVSGEICADQSGKKATDSSGRTVECQSGYTCSKSFYAPSNREEYFCQASARFNTGTRSPLTVFGKIIPPAPVENLGFGAKGLSTFLSNVIQLIYIAAAIMFVFMIIIAAFNWITSGGDKDKVSGAQKRITNAIIGIVLLACAFVIIKLIGQITGFQFFAGQEIDVPTPFESGIRNTQKDDSFKSPPTPTQNPLNRLPCAPGEC